MFSQAQRSPLRWVFATAVTGVVLATASTTVCASTAHAGESSASFLGHLNALRSQHGLAALSPASDLTSVATVHSNLMAAQGTIFHNAALRSQISNWQTLGENVGMGGSAASIDDAFDASPAHYANEINATYTQVGIGVATGQDGTIFVTLDFRRPQGAAAPAPITQPRPAPVKKVAIAPTRVPVVPSARPQAQGPAQAEAPVTVPPPATAPAPLASVCQAPSLQLGTDSDPLAQASLFLAWVTAAGRTCSP